LELLNGDAIYVWLGSYVMQIESFDPCTDNYVEAYLNDPDVQRALHANVTRLDHPWSACRYTHSLRARFFLKKIFHYRFF
jgi:hypothetical protein